MTKKPYRPPAVRTFKSEASFECPFCKKPVMVGTQDGDPAAVHQMPVCQQFEKHDPSEFLSLARQTMEGVKPS